MNDHERIDLASLDWVGIFSRLGVDERLIGNPKKRGPCPFCGGHTRFRIDNKLGRGDWVCNCGAGDGVDLVARLCSLSRRDAFIEVLRMVRGDTVLQSTHLKSEHVQEKTPEQVEKARENLVRVWSECQDIAGTPVAWYLSNRVKEMDLSYVHSGVRFHPSLWHFDNESGKKSRYPAMVLPVRDASSQKGKAVTLHRTYLSESGEKANVSLSQVKKVMATTVSKLSGESVLMNTAKAGETVLVSEGAENALAWVMALSNKLRCYAALNCYGLSTFRWPPGTKRIIIVADNDPPNPRSGIRSGAHNAAILAQRAHAEGIRTLTVMSPFERVDFDELWNEGRKEYFDLHRYVPSKESVHS